jgi:Xaa-Pro aminopeptidase
VIHTAQPGQQEDQLAAAFEHRVRSRGAKRISAPVVAAGGRNSALFRYGNNDQALVRGTVCVLDSGAELSSYSTDMTRTFPVGGKFSEAQLNLYKMVLKVQRRMIDLARPGYSLARMEAEAGELLVSGLVELGIVAPIRRRHAVQKWMSEEERRMAESYTSYGIHFNGHHIGLDIHDCIGYEDTKPFAPGMAIVIKPSVYLSHSTDILKSEYRGIGIRVEDTVLITADEPEVLTDDTPRDPECIERLMTVNELRDMEMEMESPPLPHPAANCQTPPANCDTPPANYLTSRDH